MSWEGMMAEPVYWKRCLDCGGRGTNRGGWPCKTCSFGYGYADRPPRGLVPVADGALLIEDGFDAAVGRMAAYVDVHNETGSLYGLVGLLRAAFREGEADG